MWREESAEWSLSLLVALLSICEWVCEDVKSAWSGDSAKTSHQLKVSTMDTIQLLFLLLVSCTAASAHPHQHLAPCQIVQMDVFCNDLNLRNAPVNLPLNIKFLDLSQNQVENLTQETLAYRTGFRHLSLHSNKIHFIQPGLFKDMPDLRVLDLSRNHLNVFALSKINIGTLGAVESLDISNNGLYTGMSDYFLADSPSLANLSLNSNSITKIANNTFTGLVSLRKISLHNNVILEIEDGAFDHLHNLTELDLSKNSITCIIDFNLYNLEVLNLSKNSIEQFQSTQHPSKNTYKLRSLDLSENKMPHFPLLPVYNELEYLDVSRNQIQSVNNTESPDKQPCLNRLIYLDMSYNQLSSISEYFFCHITSLEVLNMSNNCIRSFNFTTPELLQKLRIINLSYNSLQSLTFMENTLQSLEQLFLQGNYLTTLDHQIFRRLPSIRYLELEQNNLKICAPEQNQPHPSPTNQSLEDSLDCVSFSSVPNLHFLNLSENSLQTVPANAFANTPLKLLDLSLNPGLEMDQDCLSGLELSLSHLLLRNNNISSLNTDLSSLTCLKHVDLSSNQLTTLPMWNKESSVESLNLQNNNLVTLDYSTMLPLKASLKTLYLGSNPLSCCSSLSFVHMLQRLAVVMPDIEIVTCIHEDHTEPVNIAKVTPEMCQQSDFPNHLVTVFVTLIVVLIVLVLLVKCCSLRKRKRNRSFSA